MLIFCLQPIRPPKLDYVHHLKNQIYPRCFVFLLSVEYEPLDIGNKELSM